ncbi:unnamed protein product, partial [marine sediment metagenome]
MKTIPVIYMAIAETHIKYIYITGIRQASIVSVL